MPTMITSMSTKITSLPAFAGALLAFGLSAAPAEAQANRTWVSGKGTDSGTCSLSAPCRSLAFALTQTAADGEIDVLDPAGYGTVTITQAISIINDGVGTAAIQTPSGGIAITIAAGTGSVQLRGLTIEGLGTGTNGIQFNSGANLAIENCVIRDFTGAGINIAPTGSVVTGVLRNVMTYHNANGIVVNGAATTTSLNVTVVDSVASNNTGIGIEAMSGPATQVMVRDSVASYSGTGLFATGGNLRVGHSVVTGNALGVNVGTGGILFSYGDNDIDGNVNANTVILTPLMMH